MSKIVIISNRLPLTVKKCNEKLEYQESIGGLVTGLKKYHEQTESIWAGWAGIACEEINREERKTIQKELRNRHQYLPVFLTNKEVNLYYNGFCNETIWPLFHYFPTITQYRTETWEAYRHVNEKFFNSVEHVIEDGDIVWIHDYQLMLLPQMVKDRFPNCQVGFFLHIPFPSFEIFRLLIWREQILRGLLGADLIGFHTYDYVRHFLSSVRRLLGLDIHMNQISYEDRYIQVDAFPMGIAFDFFAADHEDDSYPEDVQEVISKTNEGQMILSIDRLDYTKGIPERLKAFERFLTRYPEFREKVRLNMIVAPSRVDVGYYDDLLREIRELVSQINGKFGTFTWMPVWFFFRSYSQENLIALYRHSDVLLVTPLRDGMNLVCKEYIASRRDHEGMVVISETIGAASELGEAVVVNANDYDAIADGIKMALDMPRDEKIARNMAMSRRIQRYDIDFWAGEFFNSLRNTVMYYDKSITDRNIEKDSYLLEKAYRNAKNRVLFLDYDGTLVGFQSKPSLAKPDDELRQLLRNLASDPKNTVVLVSGRDRYTLEEWFGDLDMHLFASHGLWTRHPGQDWVMTIALDNSWKESVRHILEMYTDRTPGSFIEEKDDSIAWHYRLSVPDMIDVKLIEVKETLLSLTHHGTLGLLEGNKVLEIKDNRVSKGFTSLNFISNQDFDFIFAAGDDHTDESLFSSLPSDAITVKIGLGNTGARYFLKSWQSVRGILNKFIDISSNRQ